MYNDIYMYILQHSFAGDKVQSRSTVSPTLNHCIMVVYISIRNYHSTPDIIIIYHNNYTKTHIILISHNYTGKLAIGSERSVCM